MTELVTRLQDRGVTTQRAMLYRAAQTPDGRWIIEPGAHIDNGQIQLAENLGLRVFGPDQIISSPAVKIQTNEDGEFGLQVLDGLRMSDILPHWSFVLIERMPPSPLFDGLRLVASGVWPSGLCTRLVQTDDIRRILLWLNG